LHARRRIIIYILLLLIASQAVSFILANTRRHSISVAVTIILARRSNMF
jgi:hypothetical protein